MDDPPWTERGPRASQGRPPGTMPGASNDCFFVKITFLTSLVEVARDLDAWVMETQNHLWETQTSGHGLTPSACVRILGQKY